MQKFDLVVLGGGTATSLANRMAEHGWKVALIEADRLGGTCPNRGCIPSKLFLGFAEVATTIQKSSDFYIDSSIASIDVEAIREEVLSATIGSVDQKIEGGLADNCQLFRGFGRFVGDRTIEVNGETIQGERVVVATGTRPVLPEPYAAMEAWTSDNVFTMESVPKSITIVGGGYIACELAWFFSSIGVETKMLVRGTELLKAEDQSIREIFKKAFSKNIEVQFDTSISSVEKVNDGFEMTLEVKGSGKTSTIEHQSERLLFAVGRSSTANGINVEEANINLDRKGFIKTDDRLQTSANQVYAMGDVAGRYFFTHSAAWEAIYLGDTWIKGEEHPLDYGPMPHAVFSYPEIAGVGLTEDQLIQEETAYVEGSVAYTSAGKGRAIKETNGLCKILLDPETGAILGCHIIGHHASILLHQILPVMRLRNNITSLTDMIYVHPSLSEVVRNAARVASANLASYNP